MTVIDKACPKGLAGNPIEDAEIAPLELIIEDELVRDDTDFVAELRACEGERVNMELG